jgi:hypothetical protein
MEAAMLYLLYFLGIPTIVLVGWIAYLRFCKWLVKQTGEASSLAHAGNAARGFPLGRRRAPRT